MNESVTEATPDAGRQATVGDLRPERVAVVVAGAGARGGYEAAVLSVLLPRLAAAGVRPTLFVSGLESPAGQIVHAKVPGESGTWKLPDIRSS